MVADFDVDEAVLAHNATAAAQYAQEVKSWADQFDDPGFYASFDHACGIINAPVGAALRAHGARCREMAHTLAAHYLKIAEDSTASLADVRATTEQESQTITASTEQL